MFYCLFVMIVLCALSTYEYKSCLTIEKRACQILSKFVYISSNNISLYIKHDLVIFYEHSFFAIKTI